MQTAITGNSQRSTQQQPVNTVKERLQSLLPFNVDAVLSSNSLPTGQDETNWTLLLQAFWQMLQEDEEA